MDTRLLDEYISYGGDVSLIENIMREEVQRKKTIEIAMIREVPSLIPEIRDYIFSYIPFRESYSLAPLFGMEVLPSSLEDINDVFGDPSKIRTYLLRKVKNSKERERLVLGLLDRGISFSLDYELCNRNISLPVSLDLVLSFGREKCSDSTMYRLWIFALESGDMKSIVQAAKIQKKHNFQIDIPMYCNYKDFNEIAVEYVFSSEQFVMMNVKNMHDWYCSLYHKEDYTLPMAKKIASIEKYYPLLWEEYFMDITSIECTELVKMYGSLTSNNACRKIATKILQTELTVLPVVLNLLCVELYERKLYSLANVLLDKHRPLELCSYRDEIIKLLSRCGQNIMPNSREILDFLLSKGYILSRYRGTFQRWYYHEDFTLFQEVIDQRRIRISSY